LLVRPVIALGCDPGQSAGAVVTLDTARRVVTLAAEWQVMRRKSGDVHRWRVQREGCDVVEQVTAADRPFAFAEAIGLWPTPKAAAVEGIVWQGKGGPSTITLAESAGRVVEWLRSMGIDPQRPPARLWRKVVLGLPHTTEAAVAERAAVRACERGHLPKLPSGIDSGHAAEACAIAWWAGLRVVSGGNLKV